MKLKKQQVKSITKLFRISSSLDKNKFYLIGKLIIYKNQTKFKYSQINNVNNLHSKLFI